ncbi:MAG: hypothetical protein ACXQT5_06430 [Candidatus Syntropharchaeia archaeon]
MGFSKFSPVLTCGDRLSDRRMEREFQLSEIERKRVGNKVTQEERMSFAGETGEIIPYRLESIKHNSLNQNSNTPFWPIWALIPCHQD